MANSKASRAGSRPKNGASGAKTVTKSRVNAQRSGKPARTAAEVIAEANRPKQNLLFCIPAFIIPFLLTLVAYICFGVYPFGDRSVLTLDLNGQYVYYFEALRKAFWGDGSMLYNWSRNLSGGYMGIIGYYLASPFTLIVMLLPRKMLVESIMIMQMCKVASCGATFCIYAQRSKRVAPIPSVMFSTMYAMMAFVVIQLIDPMWIDGPVFLPLIILGVEYLIDDGRKANLIIPLAIMFVANFYIGFMIAIFVGIYFFYYLFFGTERKFKDVTEYLYTFATMGLAAFVALMLSLFMILPVYNALALGKFDFSKPDYSYKNLFKPLELIPCMLPDQYYSVNVDEQTRLYGRPEIYCGVMSFIMLPLYFINKKIKLNKKIGNGLVLFILLLSMYVKPINMLWHGGQDPNWLPFRYSFLFSFVVVSMAAETFSKLDGYKLSPQAVGGTFGSIALLTFLFTQTMPSYNYNQSKYKYVAVWPYKDTMEYRSDSWDEIWLGTVAIGMLFAAVYILYLFGYSRMKDKKKKTALTCLVAAVVCFETGYNCYDSFRKIFKEVGNSDKLSYTEIVTGTDVVDELENIDGGFYRSEKTYSRMVNDNSALGLKGVSHSSSVMNARALKFLESMGYFTQSFESKYEGNNPIADSLLGIKYVLHDPDRVNSSSNMLDSSYEPVGSAKYKRDGGDGEERDCTAYIYKNPTALNIGYMASDDVIDKLGTLGTDNSLMSVNHFLSAITGNTELTDNKLYPKYYYVPLETEVSYDTNRVYYHEYPYDPDGDGISVIHDCYEAYPDAGDAVVNVHMTAVQDGDIYMYLGSDVRKACNVWVSDRKDENGNFYSHDGYGSYFNAAGSPTIVRLGPFKAGAEIEVRFTIQAEGENGRYTGKNEYLMVRKGSGFNFCYLDKEAFENDINLLKQNQWEIDTEESTDRKLVGKITAQEGQIMVTTIPYEPGWTIEVDGEKYDNLVYEDTDSDGNTVLRNKAGNGEVIVVGSLIGIRLPAGEHTVKMTYTPPGFNIGIVTFVIGLACLILLYMYDRKHNSVLKARRLEKEKRKKGIVDEPKDPSKKGKVQIIKSKGAVDGEVSEAAKKKAKQAREEADKLKAKDEELLEKGKAYADKAKEEAAEAAENAAETLDNPTVKADPDEIPEEAEKAEKPAKKPASNGSKKKKKKKK